MKQLENTKEREWAKSLHTSISKGQNEGDVEIGRNLTIGGSILLGGIESHTIKTFTGTAKQCSEKLKENTWFCATGFISYQPITTAPPIYIRHPLSWNNEHFIYYTNVGGQHLISFDNDDVGEQITLYGFTNF